MHPLVLITIGIGMCLAAFVYGKRLRQSNPTEFKNTRHLVYSVVYSLLAIDLGSDGMKNKDTLRAMLNLAGFAFFATAYVYALLQRSSDQSRFSMHQLMLFVTLFALALGFRAIVQAG